MAEDKPIKVLPKLEELHYDIDKAFKNDEFKLLLNQSPPESWLKKHPYSGSKYLPIDKEEFLLDRIFQQWKIEGLREGQIFNSVYVVVRVHYLHPVTGEWMFHDGYGASGLQVDAGKKPSEMEFIKKEAVQMGLPAAKSYAIKDACDHLGKLFGRDVNRKDTLDFMAAYMGGEKQKPAPEDERLIKLIKACTTEIALNKLKVNCTNAATSQAWDDRLNEIKNK